VELRALYTFLGESNICVRTKFDAACIVQKFDCPTAPNSVNVSLDGHFSRKNKVKLNLKLRVEFFNVKRHCHQKF